MHIKGQFKEINHRLEFVLKKVKLLIEKKKAVTRTHLVLYEVGMCYEVISDVQVTSDAFIFLACFFFPLVGIFHSAHIVYLVNMRNALSIALCNMV